MYYLGIDLGTSSTKFLLVDEKGNIASEVTKDYDLIFPHPGWSEQKPSDWWEACKAGIPELIKDIDASQIAGIGCGGQMHGLVALDAEDNVIRPAILWNDGRTFEEVDYLNNEIGKDKLSEYSQHRIRRIYSTEDSLDEEERAGELCKDRKDHASEGLHQLYAHRRSLL